MSEKALATGSKCPPLKANTLRLYSMLFCPYSERTRLVLAHHNVPHDTVNVDLKSKPEWFLEKNPFGMVPVLEQGDKIVYESPICDEYLDEVYGKSSLLTTDPFERARQRMVTERFNKVISPYHAIFRKYGDLNQSLEDLHKALAVFEDLLTGKFFGGNEVKLVDYHLWPWFERFPMLQSLSSADLLPSNKFPKLNAWVARMKEVPAVKCVMISSDMHVKFVDSIHNNEKPDYDIGLA